MKKMKTREKKSLAKAAKRIMAKKGGRPGDRLKAFAAKVAEHEAKEKKTGKPAKSIAAKAKKAAIGAA